MYKRSLFAALAAMALAVLALAPTASAKPIKQAPAANVVVPVTGTVTNAAGTAVGTFAGDYTIQRVKRQGRAFYAVGTVTGVVTNTATGATQIVNESVKVPMQVASGGSTTTSGARALQQVASCEILDLTLGPLDLDLLGLVVHLDTVHLNITAEQGPGNLLGNLLCAVAGLLDPQPGGGGIGGILNQIVGLLNQILGQLSL